MSLSMYYTLPPLPDSPPLCTPIGNAVAAKLLLGPLVVVWVRTLQQTLRVILFTIKDRALLPRTRTALCTHNPLQAPSMVGNHAGYYGDDVL